MPAFILEIGVEEMPARFVPSLAREVKSGFDKLLTEAMVDFESIDTFATPRRIVALVSGITAEQRTVEEEVTGPPVNIAYKDGELTKAGSGFARTQGVAEADLYTLAKGKGEYLACKKTVGGGTTASVLPSICAEIVGGLTFPKKMRWGSRDVAFGRPVRWLLALLDTVVVDFKLEDITSGRTTWGHRVMGPGPFEIANAKDYLPTMREQGKVVLEPEVRAEVVREKGQALAVAEGGRVVWKDSLLAEVTNLVETPVPILGRIEDKFLELPREVLLTSMEKHQKSFGIEDKDGKLLPFFLTTLNLIPKNEDLVRKGWERVLKARLEDARFFWEADGSTTFDAWLKKLESVVFIGPIGTMGDKSRRLEKLCGAIAEAADSVTPGEADQYRRAGRLAKADLVSEMVIEFDSLQGLMGGIYARQKGESDVVADALYEQYLPAGPDSPVPSTLPGAVLSMADKADTLAGCFGLKMIPTGANDPYALRRAALGICRIVMDHGLTLDVGKLLADAQAGYPADVKWKVPPAEVHDKLMEFFAGRLRALFTGKGYATRVVDAAIGAGFADVRALAARIEALQDFSKAEDFEQAVICFKRAANIIRKQGDEAGETLTGGFDPDLLEEEQEKALAAKLDETGPRFDERWEQGDFSGLLRLLWELRPVVDAFFDNVMVMCDDQAMRANRLNLLKSLVDRLGRLADFNALQV